MRSSWVIRLLQAEKVNSPILVRVSRKEGGHDLDLDLLATDVRQRNLKKLRAKNYEGSDDEWAGIISFGFALQKGGSISTAQKPNLEVTCSIVGKDPKSTLSIAFRNKIEDITQHLGTIDLPQTEDTDDIDLFGWALQAAEQRDGLEEEVTDLRGKVEAKDEVVTDLQKQIQELVKTKAEHETQMLSKFTVLLNEKKLKVRNMQRVMATAQTDQKRLKQLRSVIKDEEAMPTGRRTKRLVEDVSDNEETEESEGFETMDVDTVGHHQQNVDSPESNPSTPPRSEPDDEDDDLDAIARSQVRAMNAAQDSRKKSPSPLTPRRELPSPKKTDRQAKPTVEEKRKQNSQPATMSDDEETASEDDEL
ncbi:uncharacterized protein Z518_11362 [Rhinocladiella mackenziei CBS 650.93]|uniref:XRCC4 coiled-coil domain-containing protein n=1 Tax=Rhinocladiella mackenziei CBS 650.93 TaxID=1442369 RepID=A0A0D2IRJ1_9EURO|nr:uncharacterized protein Z518_11362 [Rhinocladiella mackenziei CBS 650.93]KIW99374.1 hypothetical protein Z518_11362 [Rhinocladiella mackenziei CBS 650.93]